MPVLSLIILISLIMENSGDSFQYVVTLTPNWNHIYTDDSVTLKCDIGPNNDINNYDFNWYKDNKMINQKTHEFTIRNAKSTDEGVYECWPVGSGDRSHSLRLYVISKVSDIPRVTFNPNYRNIFVGEKMNFSCELSTLRNQIYTWYKDGVKLKNDQKNIIIEKANSNDIGNYKCEKWSKVSYPLRLDVYSDHAHEVILQTPHNIVEGDSLDVRCHSYSDPNDEEPAIFYKDGDKIQESQHILHLSNVNKSMTGIYRCEKIIQNEKLSKAKESFIFIQDLFTSPTIKAPSSIKEGREETLTCDTRSNPLRHDTELQFSFYKNGEKVREFGPSNKYRIKPAQLEDSGNYTCGVRTPLDTVIKMSEMSYISITELFRKLEVQIYPERVQEGDNLEIKCLDSQSLYRPFITFYRDSQTVQNRSYNMEYVIPHLLEEHTGNYKCSLTYRGICKNSTKFMILVLSAVDKPKLMILSSEVAVGDYTSLRCESSKGSPPIHYLFYHNQTLLGNITTHQKEAAELKLSIESLTMGGLYYCASYNDFLDQHQKSEIANLLVMEPVADINITADKEGEDFVLGESLTLSCSVQHGTSISVFWKHNETLVEQNSELYQLQDNGKVLYIQSLQYHHRGTYRCKASNQLHVNRTFSVLSEIRNINVLELNAVDYTIQLSVLGILLLVFILAIGLIVMYREKILGSCHKKPPSTGLNTEQNNEDIDKQNTATIPESLYENVPSRENEDEGYTYITVKATKAPSAYPAAATRENDMVMYSMVKCSEETSETKTDQKTSEMSDSNCIYRTITADNINDHHHQ